jgi:hypothetical protein
VAVLDEDGELTGLDGMKVRLRVEQIGDGVVVHAVKPL